MGMCKKCNEVYSALEMTDGVCKKCLESDSTIDNDISQEKVETTVTEEEKPQNDVEPNSKLDNSNGFIKIALGLILIVLIVVGIILNSFISKFDKQNTPNGSNLNIATVINTAKLDGDSQYLVERICINGYVYINMYQKKPVMTIQYGTSTALTQFPVLQSTTQSFIRNDLSMSVPEKCR